MYRLLSSLLTWKPQVSGSLMALLVLTFSALPAQAGGNFELFAGQFEPSVEGLDEESTVGARIGLRFSRGAHFELSVSRLETEGSVFNVASAEAELLMADLSLVGHFFSDAPVELLFYGGLGWAQAEAEVRVFGLQVANESEESASAHLGAGLSISLGDTLYLRPDVKARWFGDIDDQDDDIQWEGTLALGFRWGR